MTTLAILLTVFSCAWAKLLDGDPISFSSYDVDVSIGHSKQHYTPLTHQDEIASKNTILWIISLLPSFDPYTLDKMEPILFDNFMATGDVRLFNLVVTGAKGLGINSLETRMYEGRGDPYRVDFNVTLPLIQASVDIEAQVSVLTVLLEFTGNVRILIEGLSISGSLSAVPDNVNGQKVFQHNSLQAHAHVDNIQIYLDSDNVNPGMENDKDLLVAGVSSMKEVIAESIAKILIEKSNEILAQYSRERVEEYLRKPSRFYNF